MKLNHIKKNYLMRKHMSQEKFENIIIDVYKIRSITIRVCPKNQMSNIKIKENQSY